MRFISLTCPICNSRFTVSSNAPARVSCPICLSSMPNPSSGEDIEPVPVIPVEQASSSDRKIAAGLLVLLGILVLLGAAVVVRSSAMPQLPIVLVIIAAFLLFRGIVLLKREQAGVPDTAAPGGRVQRRTDVLSYESSSQSAGFSEVTKGCGIVSLVVLGVILLLFGVCAVGMLSQSLGH